MAVGRSKMAFIALHLHGTVNHIDAFEISERATIFKN